MTDPFMQLLGIEVRSVEAGRAHLAARVGPQHLNFHGSCHGGFLYSLADAAFALASNSHGVAAVALSTHMEYFKPVREGDQLEAQASQENLGRRTATYRIAITREGQTVALFTGTVYRMSEERS
ncbi:MULTISPECIES: hydroxyphenylacetyl-CoA thioesterase PaaI [unclassified Meiothermus]|uniref:hydroxyphenylacetyl-CoA thioesterase PaaI n=1 Tax=unclassified Meiothermus TaxID=370471 RepID=UPI000D7C3770|nr:MULTISPECIES: hydroxyphenylacetyl-CoA thioesterase PaaI [unclassified Meiothermus]PZA08013.1 hydroxyphenylacetyl-CoA thioesterase PaaI [Meiothermus sp. Pnk-1]RYM32208.1 hydroxyphenylacetyl-CoA thioesterase PaaI [Meiothermus sp. PNK-Is4]